MNLKSDMGLGMAKRTRLVNLRVLLLSTDPTPGVLSYMAGLISCLKLRLFSPRGGLRYCLLQSI